MFPKYNCSCRLGYILEMRPAPVLSCRSTSPLEKLDSLLCEPSPQTGMCTLDLYSNLLRRNMNSSAHCTPAGCNPPVNKWNIRLCINVFEQGYDNMWMDGSSSDLRSNSAIPDAKLFLEACSIHTCTRNWSLEVSRNSLQECSRKFRYHLIISMGLLESYTRQSTYNH